MPKKFDSDAKAAEGVTKSGEKDIDQERSQSVSLDSDEAAASQEPPSFSLKPQIRMR